MFVKFVLEPPKQLCGIYLIHMFQHYIIDFWLSGHIVPSQVGVRPTWVARLPSKHHSFWFRSLELVGTASVWYLPNSHILALYNWFLVVRTHCAESDWCIYLLSTFWPCRIIFWLSEHILPSWIGGYTQFTNFGMVELIPGCPDTLCWVR